MNKIASLEKEILATNDILNAIEKKKDVDLDDIKSIAAVKTWLFTDHKIRLEKELFAQKILRLCHTGR